MLLMDTSTPRWDSLVVQLDDLVAVLLQVVEVLNLVLVALHRLGVGLLQVHVLHRKQLLLVVQDLVHLGDTHAGHVTGPSQ